jgi:DNA-binding phage protein
MTPTQLQLFLVRGISLSRKSMAQISADTGISETTLRNMTRTDFNPRLDNLLTLMRYLKLHIDITYMGGQL